MPVTYTKTEKPTKKNCFEIKFCYEHGDADSRTYDTMVFDNMSEDQLVAYVKEFNEVKKMIDDNRSYGTELPKYFSETTKSESFIIPIEYDNYAKMHMDNYYAAVEIENISHYDENGVQSKVNVE